MEDVTRTRARADERFQAFVTEELSGLRNSLAQEEKVRAAAARAALPLRRSRLVAARSCLSAMSLTPALTVQAREAEDDEIVEAMNRYTKKLQSSLHIINSTEE